MILFYSQDLSGNTAQLEEDEFQHCCKVLRHKVGDTINVTDGLGTRVTATISEVKKRIALLELADRTTTAASETGLTLAVAIPKTKVRWEWILEKAVEIGVDTIIPLVTERTERSRYNEERCAKILRSAALQSLRPFHPRLSEQVTTAKLLAALPEATDRYLCHYRQENKALHICKPSHKKGLILIGPEGDFTKSEVDAALDHKFIPVNISDNRLRTETAAIVAINLMKTIGY